MAYFVGAGDTAQLDYIVKTLDSKLYIKPGVTANRDVQIPSAEVVNYWVKQKSVSGETMTPGSKHTQSALGLDRKSVTISKAENLDGVIAGVNVATVSADTVNAYVIEGTIEAANKINRDFLSVLEGGAVTASTAKADDVYQMILDLAAEFKVANKSDYMKPTACFVSPAVYAKLIKNNLIYFKDNQPVSVFDFEVIEAEDLANEVVMMNQVAMISGISFNAVETFNAVTVGFPGGTAFSGEIAYVNALTDLGAKASTLKPILAIAK